jgi:type II secretory pathway component GspD/PulD (secretin)
MRIPLLAALLTFACFAQSDTDRVFTFSEGTTPLAMQQIANAVRTVPEITQCYLDPNARTITIHADAEQVNEAQWIFDQFNSPQALRSSSYAGTISGPANQLRIYRPSYVQKPQEYQEVVNAVRTVPGITRAFPFTDPNAIVLRAEVNQMAAADWLIQQLDQPGITPTQRASQTFQTNIAQMPEMAVIYLSNISEPQAFQELVNAIRVIPQLTKVFPDTTKRAITIGGTADRVTLAQWLAAQLDKSVPLSAAQVTPAQAAPSGESAEIFFMPGTVSEDSFKQTVTTVRGAIESKGTFPCISTRALVVRGTPQQLAQAGQIVAQASPR